MPQQPYAQEGSQLNVAKTPMLESFSSELFNVINSQETTIYHIEAKLHLIIDKRNSEKDVQSESTPAPIEDVQNQLSKRLDVLRANNSNLERILKHLSEIV